MGFILNYISCRVENGGRKERDGCSKGMQRCILVMEMMNDLEYLDINGGRFDLTMRHARALLKLWLPAENLNLVLFALCSNHIVLLFHVKSTSLIIYLVTSVYLI